MAVAIRDTSLLKFARLFQIDEVECWELPEYPTILPADDDITYTVLSGDRIDRIAKRFYDSYDLWRIIALANGMTLLPSELYEGAELRIPSRRRVFSEILRSASRAQETKR
jgi:nucleoid-associated protein YgaU